MVLLWHLLERASDLTLVKKDSMSLCAQRVFFLLFVRLKTSDEQGVSLCPDANPVTCPIAALALQIVPATSLLPHLPLPPASDFDAPVVLTSLTEVLQSPAASEGLMLGDAAATTTKTQVQWSATQASGIHVCEPAAQPNRQGRWSKEQPHLSFVPWRRGPAIEWGGWPRASVDH